MHIGPLSFTIIDSKTSKILQSMFSFCLHLDIWKRVRGKKASLKLVLLISYFFPFESVFGQNKSWQIPWGQGEEGNLNSLLEIWKACVWVQSCNFTSTAYRLLRAAQGFFFFSHQGNKEVQQKQIAKPWDFFETSLLFSRQLCFGQVSTGSRTKGGVACSGLFSLPLQLWN